MLRAEIGLGIVLLGLLPIWGCGMTGDSPDATARRFWSAIERGDFEAAREASTPTDLRRLEEISHARTGWTAVLAEPIANEETARVPTTFSSESGEGNPFDFDTHLTRIDGEWRVDAALTHRELRQAAFAASLRDAQDALGEAGRVLGDAIEEGAREATRAIREALEELERGLDGGREL